MPKAFKRHHVEGATVADFVTAVVAAVGCGTVRVGEYSAPPGSVLAVWVTHKEEPRYLSRIEATAEVLDEAVRLLITGGMYVVRGAEEWAEMRRVWSGRE